MLQNTDTYFIINKIKEYVKVQSVISFEDAFISYLKSDFSRLGYDCIIFDGYLIVRSKNFDRNSSYSFVVHVDRHGIVKNQKGEYEFAEYYAKKKFNIPIRTHPLNYQKKGERYLGEQVKAYSDDGKVIAEGKIKGFKADNERETVLFMIKGSGFDKLPVNYPIALSSDIILKDELLSGQLDNVISVAIMYFICKRQVSCEIIFTRMEEVGKSWEITKNYLMSKSDNSKNVLILDTTPYKDIAKISSGEIVFRESDPLSEFNINLVNELKHRAGKLKIPFLIKTAEYKLNKISVQRTELGKLILETKKKITGATIQIPSVNYHTAYETVSLSSLKNYIIFIESLIRKRGF